MNWKAIFNRILTALNPAPPVGGLSIGDTALRFLRIHEGKKITSASLKLPPGILENGRIKDADKLTAALKTLHSQILPLKNPIHVILNLPGSIVYSQSFTIPALGAGRLEEAARLNLEMISPLDLKSSYHGWQKIGEQFGQSAQIELLGAFVEASLVDEFFRVLAAANFSVVAVEFPALAIARVVGRELERSGKGNFLLTDISSEGTALMVIKNFNLYFNHFHTWSAIGEELNVRQLSRENFEQFLIKEIQKVLNFWSGRGEIIENIILLASNLDRTFAELIRKNFGLKVITLTLKSFPNLTSQWLPVLGSALRATLPRVLDNFISLTNAPVQVQYSQARLLSFISLWRKIALTVIVFIMALVLALDFLIFREQAKIEAQLSATASSREIAEAEELQGKAREFNDLVNLAGEARDETPEWSRFISQISNLTAGQTALKRVLISQNKVSLSATSPSEQAMLIFKDRLLQNQLFKSVDLPLSGIKTNPDGTVNFTVSFELTGLTF